MTSLLQLDRLQLDRSPVEQLQQNSISAQAVLPLLTQYHLIPQLLGAGIIDPAIAPIKLLSGTRSSESSSECLPNLMMLCVIACWKNTLSSGFKRN